MSHVEWTPKVIVVSLVGSVATILFIMSGTRFWRHQFQPAIWQLALGLLLVLIFFRSRKIALSLIALTFVFVNAALDFPFHPTVPGFIIVTVTGALIVIWCIVVTNRYPNFYGKDFNKIFDRDQEP
jgi:uncharacterized membrane protein